MPEANPRAQHARNSRRGGINSYLRGRGSRSERGPVCACVRARASLALRLPIQCHRHISTEPPPPPPPAAPATGSAQGRPRPTPARAPLIEPGAHQSAPPLPVLGRLPRARRPLPLPLQLPAPARARARAPASRLPGSAAAQYPSAARGWERAHPRPGARVAAPPPASDCAPGRSG